MADPPAPPTAGRDEQTYRDALALHRRGELAAAQRLYHEILAGAPAHFGALHMLGLLQHQLGRYDAAVESIREAIAVDPAVPAAYVNLCLPLQRLQRLGEALAACDAALALQPDYANALINRGNVLMDMRRAAEALASYDRAVALRPDYAEAHYNRGNALLDLERHADALASFDAALALREGYVQAHYNRGVVLQELKRPEEAAGAFERLLALAPDHPFARGWRLHAKMHACHWAGLDEAIGAIDADVRAGRRSVEPFVYQATSSSPRDLRRCAEIFVDARYPPAPAPLWNGERYDHRRIRLGYVSGEFGNQATSVLMAELYERHDRTAFELVAFDSGWSDRSPMRRRLEAAFDDFVDISQLDDPAAAQAIRAREIDVLVNLNGFFGRARQGVFARRPAPVQVNYLGFPGTLGAAYIDYIVADARVIPDGDDRWYAERVVRLPDSYQANDTARAVAERAPSRAQCGLPDAGFVFCCFNNTYKLTPRIFDVWMRLLRDVPGSVLWLLEANADAVRNLRAEAERRSVAAGRLVFAAPIGLPAHLARHRNADLFLDTLPYNAHTTASDALWAELPVLTVLGGAFAGRVGASLLDAIGLPELVTADLQEYEARARELATSPERLAPIRARLARNRTTHPLFDTERFRRHIEAAYLEMHRRRMRGEPPGAFAVTPQS